MSSAITSGNNEGARANDKSAEGAGSSTAEVDIALMRDVRRSDNEKGTASMQHPSSDGDLPPSTSLRTGHEADVSSECHPTQPKLHDLGSPGPASADPLNRKRVRELPSVPDAAGILPELAVGETMSQSRQTSPAAMPNEMGASTHDTDVDDTSGVSSPTIAEGSWVASEEHRQRRRDSSRSWSIPMKRLLLAKGQYRVE